MIICMLYSCFDYSKKRTFINLQLLCGLNFKNVKQQKNHYIELVHKSPHKTSEPTSGWNWVTVDYDFLGCWAGKGIINHNSLPEFMKWTSRILIQWDWKLDPQEQISGNLYSLSKTKCFQTLVLNVDHFVAAIRDRRVSRQIGLRMSNVTRKLSIDPDECATWPDTVILEINLLIFP